MTYLKSATNGPTDVDKAMRESRPLPIMRDVIVGKWICLCCLVSFNDEYEDVG